MSITPFHFACHAEERLRALCTALDTALGDFIQIQRRFSLTEKRASLQIGAKVPSGEEFTAHVTFSIQTVPQRDLKTAFNCVVDCPAEKLQISFRLLLSTLEESEPKLLKVLGFLQKAFKPLNYTTAPVVQVEEPSPLVAAEADAMATAHKLMSSVGKSADDGAEPLAPEALEVTGGKKYIVEDGSSDTVRMRTHDGKYVPDGALPAKIHVGKTNSPIPSTPADVTPEVSAQTPPSAQ